MPQDAAPGAAEAPRFNIEIARVRRVMVAPRVRPEQRQAQSTEEPNPAPSAPLEMRTTQPPPDLPAAAVAPEPPPPRRLAYGAAMPRTATIGSEAPARQAMPSIPETAPQPIALASSGGADAAPGRPPSTLQQQAMALSAGPPREMPQQVAQQPRQQPTYRLQGPPQVAARGDGLFQIQVGAYATAVEAERQLSAVQSRSGRLLETHQRLAVPVTKGNRQLYRARFAGFDANGAAQTCTELRRAGVDCFVMRAE
jgi:D-alanyl-D-alanine carboxypeptidase